MKKRKGGFTLIEVMIVVAILGILAAIATSSYRSLNSKNISKGINGSVETRCIEGLKFVIGSGGNTHQIMDGAGKGVHCEDNNLGGLCGGDSGYQRTLQSNARWSWLTCMDCDNIVCEVRTAVAHDQHDIAWNSAGRYANNLREALRPLSERRSFITDDDVQKAQSALYGESK